MWCRSSSNAQVAARAIEPEYPTAEFRSTQGLVLALLGFLFVGSAAAAVINYGDFSGTSLMYLDVTETANTPGDMEPLFGEPSVTGNKLGFDPKGFVASASSGSLDITDGQLNFTLVARDPSVLTTITLAEGGDYSLVGTGTAATRVIYGVSVGSIRVLEVDGVALATPVGLAGASASASDDLSGGPDALTPWNLSLAYDMNAALNAAGVSYTRGATRVEISIDDSLFAFSESESIAEITKSGFMIDVGTTPLSVPALSAGWPVALMLGLLSAEAILVLRGASQRTRRRSARREAGPVQLSGRAGL